MLFCQLNRVGPTGKHKWLKDSSKLQIVSLPVEPTVSIFGKTVYRDVIGGSYFGKRKQVTKVKFLVKEQSVSYFH